MKWLREKKVSQSCNGIVFVIFCIQLFLSVQTLSLRGHWRSSVLLRVKQLSKLITNVLNPDFTVGLIPANPSIGAARSPEVLKSWVKNQLNWKLFSLLVSRKIVIVSFETKFLLRKTLLVSRLILCAVTHFEKIPETRETALGTSRCIGLLWSLDMRQSELLWRLFYCSEANMIFRLGPNSSISCCSLPLPLGKFQMI